MSEQDNKAANQAEERSGAVQVRLKWASAKDLVTISKLFRSHWASSDGIILLWDWYLD